MNSYGNIVWSFCKFYKNWCREIVQVFKIEFVMLSHTLMYHECDRYLELVFMRTLSATDILPLSIASRILGFLLPLHAYCHRILKGREQYILDVKKY